MDKDSLSGKRSLILIILIVRVVLVLVIWLVLFLAMFLGYFTIPLLIIGGVSILFGLGDVGLYFLMGARRERSRHEWQVNVKDKEE